MNSLLLPLRGAFLAFAICSRRILLMLVYSVFYGLKCDVLSIHCKWTKNCDFPLHKVLKFIYKMYEHKQ